MDEPIQDNYQPFAFDQLEHKTIDYLEKIRREAQQIADKTKQEIVFIKEKTEQELFRLRAKLDEQQKQLESQKAELEAREERLNQRQEEIDQKTFEESRKSGFEKGFEEGKIEGMEQGKIDLQKEWEERFQAELQTKLDESTQMLLPVLNKMNVELFNVRQSLINYWEGNILQISAAIAYQAIMTELPKIKEIPLNLLQEAIDLCVGHSSIKVRMNPRNVQELKPQIEMMLKEISKIASAEVIADPEINLGGCVIETSQGTINQQIETRLERIIAELSDVYSKP